MVYDSVSSCQEKGRRLNTLWRLTVGKGGGDGRGAKETQQSEKQEQSFPFLPVAATKCTRRSRNWAFLFCNPGTTTLELSDIMGRIPTTNGSVTVASSAEACSGAFAPGHMIAQFRI